MEGEGLGLVTQSSYERKRPSRVSLNPPREARTAAVSRYADRHAVRVRVSVGMARNSGSASFTWAA